jgi:hypothetical protein
MQEDLAPWFPHQQPYYFAKAMSSIGSLFLSRVPIEQHLPKGRMGDDARIARMKADAPPTGKLAQGRRKIPDEAAIVSRLAVLAAGLDVPRPVRRK